MADSKKSVEKELKAIQEVIDVLSGLEATAVSRILKYALEHLGISVSLSGIAASLPTGNLADRPIGRSSGEIFSSQIIDIKSLKETKQPASGIEMAVLVGYYLTECAPEADKAHEFGVKDAEKYFKQGGFKLPPKMKFTLNNAKNAGYLDSAGHGKYKLNPVGYNLIAHNLPAKNSKK